MKITVASISFLIVGILSGCATVDQSALVNATASRPPVEAPPIGSTSAHTAATIDVTPVTTYRDLDVEDSKVSFSNAYTRILIRSETYERSLGSNASTAPASNSMPYAQRPWLDRFLLGKRYDLNVSVKVKIGDYDETVPLATLSKSSDRNGESWSRVLTHGLASFPWFLVKEGSASNVPQITLGFNGNQTVESGIAGSVFQVALSGIKMVSPQANLITKLSSGPTKDRATAIDSAIGKLFSSKMVEQHVSDRNFGKWRPDGGLNFVVNIPLNEGDWNGSLASMGGWTIGFDSPRPSIFSDWYICKPLRTGARCKSTFAESANEVYRDRNANEILSYPLIKSSAGDVSIKTYLLQQTWYGAASTSFTGDPVVDIWTANGLCVSTADAMLLLGLNNVDANLVVWAMVEGIQHSRVINSGAWGKAERCATATRVVTSAG